MSRFRRKGFGVPLRERFKKKAGLSVASKALSLAKRNRKDINKVTEFNIIDADVTGTFNATPFVKAPTYRGDGKQTYAKSIRVKGWVKKNTSSSIPEPWRIDIVLDRQYAAAASTPLLVYGSATPPVYAMRNHVYKERFKVLRSIVGMMQADDTGSMNFDEYVKINLQMTSKTDDAFGASTCTKNYVFVYFWTTASANQPTYAVRIRTVTQDVGDGV